MASCGSTLPTSPTHEIKTTAFVALLKDSLPHLPFVVIILYLLFFQSYCNGTHTHTRTRTHTYACTHTARSKDFCGHVSKPEKKLVVPTFGSRKGKNSRSGCPDSSLSHSEAGTKGKSLLPPVLDLPRGAGVLDFKKPFHFKYLVSLAVPLCRSFAMASGGREWGGGGGLWAPPGQELGFSIACNSGSGYNLECFRC